MNIYEELMQEPPGGVNHASYTRNRDSHRHVRRNDLADEFMRSGGWQVFTAPKLGVARSGATAHRGVVHSDEHVDMESLRAAVVEKLGFTSEEIETAFSDGRPSLQRASLRAKIDARLLALSRAGGNMLALARALGWPIQNANGDGTCRKLMRSLERAKAVEAAVAA